MHVLKKLPRISTGSGSGGGGMNGIGAFAPNGGGGRNGGSGKPIKGGDADGSM